ncbi:putative nucleic acid-binding, replication factor A [Helianthus annuus]|uniref:uncharacterized protein LOC110884751 isoform X1 n=1 Tax=Helianthus annuus TaxID=4232 RepID=UPI000B8F1BF6|nr:uncharacterized protein LOC110884751 isoform X1 [Helianthus annuus]XP_021988157.1 uncharacterized protein LOC110884751 isoform X1 [Helianthus annuus]XP_021988158.1 uncharacterized protein LOC110884751 isoform X1 [Helianthus annuus]XP_021988159.1 uncharacterized protein LOC110884751 isoform X1 [Helianthus annuus]XP_021988161.1 uncharacterized protein LOC110884751 isoform X1 [Helianthus annuus]XP_021988162.1 uncharacterized protein LOC110884751 isoform X1 [Helianthus annuus]XP_021988163.1 un
MQPVTEYRKTPANMKKTTAVANCSESLATLEEILHHGRENKKHTNAEFNCRVVIKGVRNSEEWFRLMCGGGKCMKGVSRDHRELWCVGCENPVMFPRARFHLELDVLDSTSNAVIVCFDDTAQILTSTTAQSILNVESGLSHIYTVYSESIQDNFTPVMIQNSNGSISAIPNCLHSLVGTTRTIQVDTSTYYHLGAFESFNCKRVLQDETNCQSVGSTTPTPMTRKGKGVMIIPTPVKLKETIRKYIPTYEGSDSDGSMGSAPGESPTYEGSYSDGSVGSAPGERQETTKGNADYMAMH